MNCPYCKIDIENDSYYCDQCGQEIKICSLCKKPGKGNFCVDDKGKLVSMKEFETQSLRPAQPVAAQRPSESPQQSLQNKNSDIRQFVEIPCLRLVNSNLQIDIIVKSGDVVGRETGDYKKIFGKFDRISSRHARFDYSESTGWTVTDIGSFNLGSTNGTAFSLKNEWGNNPSKMAPNKPTPIFDGGYILLANVELEVHISGGSAGTARI